MHIAYESYYTWQTNVVLPVCSSFSLHENEKKTNKNRVNSEKWWFYLYATELKLSIPKKAKGAIREHPAFIHY